MYNVIYGCVATYVCYITICFSVQLISVASGCPENIDEYSLIWKSAVAGKNVTLPCPNGTGRLQ